MSAGYLMYFYHMCMYVYRGVGLLYIYNTSTIPLPYVSRKSTIFYHTYHMSIIHLPYVYRTYTIIYRCLPSTLHLHRTFTLHLQYIYSTSTVNLPYFHYTSTVCLWHIYRTSIVHLLDICYMYFFTPAVHLKVRLTSVHLLHIYSKSTVHLIYIYTVHLQLLYFYCTSTVYLLYVYCTSTIYLLYIYSLLHLHLEVLLFKLKSTEHFLILL
jgi:hypothetical protein